MCRGAAWDPGPSLSLDGVCFPPQPARLCSAGLHLASANLSLRGRLGLRTIPHPSWAASPSPRLSDLPHCGIHLLAVDEAVTGPRPFKCSLLVWGPCRAGTARPVPSPDWPLTGSLALFSAVECPAPASLSLDSSHTHRSGLGALGPLCGASCWAKGAGAEAGF